MRGSRRWERLNEAEARLVVDSPALPARVPHPALTALTTVARAGSSSFPSAHSATAAAFGTAVLAHHRRLGAVLLPLPLAVIYSRVRTRVHWPTDALAGTAIGVATAVALRPCVRRWWPGSR